MKQSLTEKQSEVLDAIRHHQYQHGVVPTYKELAEALGLSSPNSASQYLQTLQEKGYVERLQAEGRWQHRNYQLRHTNARTVAIPCVGRVACGPPILAAENIEEYHQIDLSLLKSRPEDFFLLEASGASMDQAGIEDGDLLLVERQSTAESGEMVVALIKDEVTVKVFRVGDGYISLMPRSSSVEHKPIVLRSNFAVQGVVRQVFRREDLEG